jgi:predicted nucleic acid-binding protein
VIAYFDTSALIPLIVDEPGSAACARLWNEAERVVSSRLVHPEARAALAQAKRMKRLTASELKRAVRELDSIVSEISFLELSAELATSAGDLAQTHGLRGYDAVHLASALLVHDEELVLVTGDRQLAEAARAVGMAVAITVP